MKKKCKALAFFSVDDTYITDTAYTYSIESFSLRPKRSPFSDPARELREAGLIYCNL